MTAAREMTALSVKLSSELHLHLLSWNRAANTCLATASVQCIPGLPGRVGHPGPPGLSGLNRHNGRDGTVGSPGSQGPVQG